MPPLSCVLFDLDGTLLDTAPDLIAALNRALRADGVAAVSGDGVMPHISGGAAAMVRYSLGENEDETLFARVHARMLDEYERHIADETRLFAGMADVLEEIEGHRLKWGIVTNKLARFTEPLLKALNLRGRSACVVSGDSTANSKPHPQPMLEACARIGSPPEACLYVGDSSRDIAAGKGVGMLTLAAAYGYVPEDEDPQTWGADGLLYLPTDLLPWLDCND